MEECAWLPFAHPTVKTLLLVAAALVSPSGARPALEKPNVVIVFLDDAGYGDFSHTGNPTINTPNLSKMVRDGLNLPQFYCGSSACSASRYSLLTGRNPFRSGLDSWVLGPDSKKYLHPNEITLAEGLKHSGYATGMFGNWHLGTPCKANDLAVEALPLAHGFDQWLGTNVSHDLTPGVDLIQSNPSASDPVVGYETLEKNVGGNGPVATSPLAAIALFMTSAAESSPIFFPAPVVAAPSPIAAFAAVMRISLSLLIPAPICLSKPESLRSRMA